MAIYISKVSYMRRLNLGNYEHEELSVEVSTLTPEEQGEDGHELSPEEQGAAMMKLARTVVMKQSKAYLEAQARLKAEAAKKADA